MTAESIGYWYGTPIAELPREELLEVIRHLAHEIKRLEVDRNRWMEAGDVAKYLFAKGESE